MTMRADFSALSTFRGVPTTVPAILIVAGVLILVSQGGCESGGGSGAIPGRRLDQAERQKYQKQWQLAQDPGDVKTIPEARAAVEANGAAPLEIHLAGRIGAAKQLIGAGTSYPWEPGQASFMIGDPKLEAESHQHGPDEGGCAFCARRARDGSALVQFLSGEKPLDVDSRNLFSLREGQDVIVSGTARLNALDQLVIDAKGIFIVP